VDQQDRRALGIELLERSLPPDPVAARQVAQVREPVGAAGQILPDAALASEPASREVREPAREP